MDQSPAAARFTRSSARPAAWRGNSIARQKRSVRVTGGRSKIAADATRSAWRFRASDVDIAGHVNNAAYWGPVEELFMEIGEPSSVDMEIEYRDPAQPGDASILRSESAMWVTDDDGAAHASIVGLPESVPAG